MLHNKYFFLNGKVRGRLIFRSPDRMLIGIYPSILSFGEEGFFSALPVLKKRAYGLFRQILPAGVMRKTDITDEC